MTVETGQNEVFFNIKNDAQPAAESDGARLVRFNYYFWTAKHGAIYMSQIPKHEFQGTRTYIIYT